MAYVKDMIYSPPDLERAAAVMYGNLKIERGEKVVIIYDGVEDGKRIVDALYKKGAEFCGNGCVSIVEIESHTTRNASAPINIELYDCDVLVAVTGKSVTHAKEVVEAVNRGARGFSIPGEHTEYEQCNLKEYNFVRPAYTNMNLIALLANCVKESLGGVNELTICTGPDDMYKLTLELDWENNKPFNDDGRVPKRDEYGKVIRPGIIRNWPFGEYAVLPKYRVGSGEILINLTSESDRPGVLHIENGDIVGWDENMAKFAELLKSRDKKGSILAELGFGISPDICFGATILYQGLEEAMLKDTLSNEKMAYTLHLGFGNNANFGGSNHAKIHKDAIVILPRLSSGGREIMLWKAFDEIISPGRPDFSPLYDLWEQAPPVYALQ